MLILKTKNAGLWVRHMRCLSLPVDENGNARSGGQYLLIPTRSLSRSKGVHQRAASKEEEDTSARTSPTWVNETLPAKAPAKSVFPFGTFYNNGNGQDLRRFLEEVGTDPKEARFWLKHFKRSSESVRPFAIVQIDGSIFQEPETLDKLASTLAFLHRNNMKCVVVHGESLKGNSALSQEELKQLRADTSQQSMLLASVLELHGAPARPLFAGSNIIQATPTSPSNLVGNIVGLNPDPVYWAIQSDHIPIIQGIGESFSGQMLGLDVCNATAQLAQMLQPRKVLFIKTSGGITNEKNEVIPNINLPCSDEFLEQPWCTPEVRQQIEFVSSVLYSLPQQSSVVVTAANKLLAELFTHHGSGTFFKLTEPILRYDSLKGVDAQRLVTLFNKSFGRELVDEYLTKIEDNLTTLYLCEDYSAAAIVTHEPEAGVPYLDKFAVSVAKQSEGTADVLWQMIRKDFSKLSWRSRGSNPINPWYFKRCEGSWSNGQWIVFWYGGVTHTESSLIVNHALSLPSSFTT